MGSVWKQSKWQGHKNTAINLFWSWQTLFSSPDAYAASSNQRTAAIQFLLDGKYVIMFKNLFVELAQVHWLNAGQPTGGKNEPATEPNEKAMQPWASRSKERWIESKYQRLFALHNAFTECACHCVRNQINEFAINAKCGESQRKEQKL